MKHSMRPCVLFLVPNDWIWHCGSFFLHSQNFSMNPFKVQLTEHLRSRSRGRLISLSSLKRSSEWKKWPMQPFQLENVYLQVWLNTTGNMAPRRPGFIWGSQKSKHCCLMMSTVHSLSSRPGASPKHPVDCFTTFFDVLMNFSICFGQQLRVIRGSIQAGIYMFDFYNCNFFDLVSQTKCWWIVANCIAGQNFPCSIYGRQLGWWGILRSWHHTWRAKWYDRSFLEASQGVEGFNNFSLQYDTVFFWEYHVYRVL